MELLFILAFVVLLVCVVLPLFLSRKPPATFTSREMDAFRHAEAVRKELGEVQGLVGPAKSPFTLSLGGSYLPAPPKKPDDPAK